MVWVHHNHKHLPFGKISCFLYEKHENLRRESISQLLKEINFDIHRRWLFERCNQRLHLCEDAILCTERARIAAPRRPSLVAPGRQERHCTRYDSADCALGSGEWAEPPQYLPALCWGVLKNPSKRGFYRHKAASQRLAIERLQCVQHASHSS